MSGVSLWMLCSLSEDCWWSPYLLFQNPLSLFAWSNSCLPALFWSKSAQSTVHFRCMVGLLMSSVGVWIQGVCVFLFVVLYLGGKPLYSIRIYPLLFHLFPLLGLIFGLCFWSASVSGLCVDFRSLWVLFSSFFCWFTLPCQSCWLVSYTSLPPN